MMISTIEEDRIPEIQHVDLDLKFEHYYIIIVILTTITLWLFHGLISSFDIYFVLIKLRFNVLFIDVYLLSEKLVISE